MQFPYFVIDAFITEQMFSGNPAGVCFLPHWIADSTLQQIAAQNNLSETAFLVAKDKHGDGSDQFELRWFTPTVEVDLCGHATLAPAYLLLEHTALLLEHGALLDRGAVAWESVTFHTRAGRLTARRYNDLIELNFPAYESAPANLSSSLLACFDLAPSATFDGHFPVLMFNSQTDIERLQPDFQQMQAASVFIVLVTAPGDEVDFVSRVFAPGAGIPEDPVTGAAHSVLAPLWAQKLQKSALQARQLSARGGSLVCTSAASRVTLAGRCRLYLAGTARI